MKAKLILTYLTLMLCMGVLCVPAFASDETVPELERLTISTAWTSGDLLHIEVKDNETGAVSTVELRLSDYADNAETITIQAIDEDGNASGVIHIANPFYKAPSATTGNNTGTTPTESVVPDSAFTSDGTGTVVDNVTEQNGKEFFTIKTVAGNEFFLIVDRERSADNVYLLNTVTENDLMALAEKGDGTTQSAIPNPSSPPADEHVGGDTPPSPEPEPEPEPEPAKTGGGTIIIIVFIVLAIGGAGYYFKIYRPKHDAPPEDVEYDGYDDEPEAAGDNEKWEDERE